MVTTKAICHLTKDIDLIVFEHSGCWGTLLYLFKHDVLCQRGSLRERTRKKVLSPDPFQSDTLIMWLVRYSNLLPSFVGSILPLPVLHGYTNGGRFAQMINGEGWILLTRKESLFIKSQFQWPDGNTGALCSKAPHQTFVNLPNWPFLSDCMLHFVLWATHVNMGPGVNFPFPGDRWAIKVRKFSLLFPFLHGFGEIRCTKVSPVMGRSQECNRCKWILPSLLELLSTYQQLSSPCPMVWFADGNWQRTRLSSRRIGRAIRNSWPKLQGLQGDQKNIFSMSKTSLILSFCFSPTTYN